MKKTDKTQILNDFDQVRNQTLAIVNPLEIEDYVIQTDFFMSPPRWHLGHVSWFYDQLLRQHNKNYKPYSKNYDHYLNSYYHTFGEPFDKGRRGTISRPTVAETKQYFNWINQQVKDFFTRLPSIDDNLAYLFYMAFNHEYQHQELMIYDLQHLLQDQYIPEKVNPVTNFEPELIAH